MPAGPARGKTASTRSRCPESWRARAPAPHGCTQLCRGHDGGRSMYAVIRAGGKQYRVAPGDVVRLETQAGGKDGKVEFGDVLAVSASPGETFPPPSGPPGPRPHPRPHTPHKTTPPPSQQKNTLNT